MAETIRVTPKELQDKAQMMENTGNEIKTLTENMTTKVLELTGRIWSGEAQQAYVTRFKSLEEDIARLNELCSNEAKHLYAIAQEYSKAEETNVAASGNLSEKVII
jgi:WXG100 family type VII secretion target